MIVLRDAPVNSTALAVSQWLLCIEPPQPILNLLRDIAFGFKYRDADNTDLRAVSLSLQAGDNTGNGGAGAATQGKETPPPCFALFFNPGAILPDSFSFPRVTASHIGIRRPLQEIDNLRAAFDRQQIATPLRQQVTITKIDKQLSQKFRLVLASIIPPTDSDQLHTGVFGEGQYRIQRPHNPPANKSRGFKT